MTSPLSIECYPCRASIGVPCEPNGSTCANRIARALFINAGIVPPEVRTAAIDPGTAAPLVLREEKN